MSLNKFTDESVRKEWMRIGCQTVDTVNLAVSGQFQVSGFLPTGLFSTEDDVVVGNSTTETTLYSGASAGTPTLFADELFDGYAFDCTFSGDLTSAGGGASLTFLLYGDATSSTLIGSIVVPTGIASAKRFSVSFKCLCKLVGAVETIRVVSDFRSITDAGAPLYVGGVVETALPFSTAQVFNSTATWSSASVAHTITSQEATIKRIR